MRSYLTVRTNQKTIITKIANQKYKNQNDLIRLGVFAAVDSNEFMVDKLVRVYDECLGTDRR